ncbi:hypothetical protein FRAHR75_830019 [Frankia sp. Hr75.2]|nr:hypothetical protein FRAHR75_830019 [Frankia sp. Hr75.2]SQD98336.1 hypothetical protein FMEAI12_4620013 [Parafrankia sp. Ea1.12]
MPRRKAVARRGFEVPLRLTGEAALRLEAGDYSSGLAYREAVPIAKPRPPAVNRAEK